MVGSIGKDGRWPRGVVVLSPLVTLWCRQGAGRAAAWDLCFGVLTQAPCVMAWRKCPKTSPLFSCSKTSAD